MKIKGLICGDIFFVKLKVRRIKLIFLEYCPYNQEISMKLPIASIKCNMIILIFENRETRNKRRFSQIFLRSHSLTKNYLFSLNLLKLTLG